MRVKCLLKFGFQSGRESFARTGEALCLYILANHVLYHCILYIKRPARYPICTHISQEYGPGKREMSDETRNE